MRVAVVQEHVDTSRGGAETSTLELAAALVRLGVDVTILCRAESSRVPDAAIAGVRIVRLATAGGSRLARTRAYLDAVEDACRRERFDVVHAITPCTCAHLYQPRGGTLLETIARSLARSRNPLLRAVRAAARRFNFRQQLLLGVERDLLTRRPPPRVAALSRYVINQVRTGYPELPETQIDLVYNAVAIEPLSTDEATAAREHWHRRLSLPGEAPLALFLAHNFPLKGLAELIRASAAGHWHLLVAGRGRDAPYRRRAARLGLAARVHFVGPQPDARPLYAAADLLAHPTWYDPCSRVVLEALCCGLPVVTTQHNGAAEVIEAGRSGEIVATPDDAPALAAAIRRALQPEYRDYLRSAAPRLREQLSMDRHARELLACFERAAGRPAALSAPAG